MHAHLAVRRVGPVDRHRRALATVLVDVQPVVADVRIDEVGADLPSLGIADPLDLDPHYADDAARAPGSGDEVYDLFEVVLGLRVVFDGVSSKADLEAPDVLLEALPVLRAGGHPDHVVVPDPRL